MRSYTDITKWHYMHGKTRKEEYYEIADHQTR